MKVKRVLMLTVVLAVVVAALSLVMASAQNGEPPDSLGLESVGVRYGQVSAPAALTSQQAVELAKSYLGQSLAKQATQVEAQYVLFSDDQYYTTDAQNQKQYYFQNVPAWVVTLRGVNFAIRGARGDSSEVEYNHEVHVVFNAQTGEFMELFTYR